MNIRIIPALVLSLNTLLFSQVAVGENSIDQHLNALMLSEFSIIKVTIGVVVQNSVANGIIVKEIIPNSPADRAGIKVNDIIRKYHGQNINSVMYLSHLVGNSYPFTKKKLIIQRKNLEHSLTIIPKMSPNYLQVPGVEWGTIAFINTKNNEGLEHTKMYAEMNEHIRKREEIDKFIENVKKVAIGIVTVGAAIALGEKFLNDDCLRPDNNCSSSQLRRHRNLLSKAKSSASYKVKNLCRSPTSAKEFLTDIAKSVGYSTAEALTITISGDSENLFV